MAEDYVRRKLGLAPSPGGKGGLSAPPEDPGYVDEVVVRVRTRLMAEVPPEVLHDAKKPEVRARLEKVVERLVREEAARLGRVASVNLANEVLSDIFGYGPIQPLVEDPEITEIMVNGPGEVWVEKGGRLHRTELKFRDDAHLLGVIERIVGPLGRRVDEAVPMVDARLPDGSRVNAIIP
ncbi:MAG: ATPase, T2SS/T4P/T4SS family, partial [Bacillota bacterium]